jgi:hypothetical protein
VADGRDVVLVFWCPGVDAMRDAFFEMLWPRLANQKQFRLAKHV